MSKHEALTHSLAALLVGAALAGCDTQNATDAGDATRPRDTGAVDTGVVDTGVVDTGVVDTGAEPTDADLDGGESADAGMDASRFDPQRPPIEDPAELEAWLAAGYYRAWTCQDAGHDAHAPSIHKPINRICANGILAAAPATGEVPVGSSSVKEVYDLTGSRLIGYAVDIKQLDYATVLDGGYDAAYDAGPDGRAPNVRGFAWYWYQRLPTALPADAAPVEDSGFTVITGPGTDPVLQSRCVGCHSRAGVVSPDGGTDAGSAHDFVYEHVR